MEGKIEKIERSENHGELRWLTINGQLYSLWDSVNDEDLAIGQLVEFEAEEVPGRNFAKISKLKPVRAKGKAKAKARSSSGFSKTELGLMISVAVKAAAQMSSSIEELTEKAEAIYSYLKAKRLSEVEEEVKE